MSSRSADAPAERPKPTSFRFDHETRDLLARLGKARPSATGEPLGPTDVIRCALRALAADWLSEPAKKSRKS